MTRSNPSACDTDGNQIYTAIDSFFVARVVVRADSGFDFHDHVDPVIVAHATGDGTLSGFDASKIARKAALLDEPDVPDLPAGILAALAAAGSADPGVDILDALNNQQAPSQA